MNTNLNTKLEEKVLRIADQYTDLVELRLKKVLEKPDAATLEEVKNIDIKIEMLNSVLLASYRLALLRVKGLKYK